MDKREYNEVMYMVKSDIKLLPTNYLKYFQELFRKWEEIDRFKKDSVLKVTMAKISDKVDFELIVRTIKETNLKFDPAKEIIEEEY